MDTVEKNTNDTNNLNISDDLIEEDFSYQDTTEIIHNTEDYKYTKIDCLDEDPPIKGQKFVLMSFVSPEGVMNCKVRGVKIRGVYGSRSEADAACEKLKKDDKYFDIFVGEVGKWLPWDPSTKQVEEVKFRNKKLDKIMSKVHESELKTLNEVVGRRKDALDKEKVTHKNRIKETIKESVETYDSNEQNNEKVSSEKKSHKVNTHDPTVVKQRLKKLLEEREKTRANKSVLQKPGLQQEPSINKSDPLESINEKKEKLITETNRIVEKTENITKLKHKSEEIENKLNKMREYFDKKKQEKTNDQNTATLS